MKLHNSIGPNPHVVRMFAAEKGLDLDLVPVDLMAGENRRGPYNTDINVAGQLPALQLESGEIICEITAICEYLEEIHPDPPLIGRDPVERAETRMWTRRVDLNVAEPMGYGFRAAEGRPLFEGRMKLLRPEGADDMKAIFRDHLAWLDGRLQGDFICGDRFSLADVLLFGFLNFGKTVGLFPPAEAIALTAWFERVGSRPSANA